MGDRSGSLAGVVSGWRDGERDIGYLTGREAVTDGKVTAERRLAYWLPAD